jgi:hypothetical protein
MKTRDRLRRIKRSGSFTERIRLSEDDLPGTGFDGLFLQSAEAWTWTHRHDPKARAKAACPVAKHFLNAPGRKRPPGIEREDDRETEAFYANVGSALVDAIVRGASDFIRDMADALDIWKAHHPQPDRLRSALLLICLPKSEAFTVKTILAKLPGYGVKLDPTNAPRIIRRLCAELGIKLRGTPGRPKKTGTRTVKNRRV